MAVDYRLLTNASKIAQLKLRLESLEETHFLATINNEDATDLEREIARVVAALDELEEQEG